MNDKPIIFTGSLKELGEVTGKLYKAMVDRHGQPENVAVDGPLSKDSGRGSMIIAN